MSQLKPMVCVAYSFKGEVKVIAFVFSAQPEPSHPDHPTRVGPPMSNFAMIMKAKSEEPSHSLRRFLTLSDKSESEEAGDTLGDMSYDRIKPAKRSRTKWIAAAVSDVVNRTDD